MMDEIYFPLVDIAFKFLRLQEKGLLPDDIPSGCKIWTQEINWALMNIARLSSFSFYLELSQKRSLKTKGKAQNLT